MRKGAYEVIYRGTNITANVKSDLVELTYIDRVEGEADEVEILLDDTGGKWRVPPWYPDKGSILSVKIGWPGQMIPCGNFIVDEAVVLGGSDGDRIKIRALSSIVESPLRTERNRSFTKAKFRKIINTVASDAKLTVSGNIEDVTIDYMAQKDETDLAFLHRISEMYGYVFNVKSTKLVFTKKSTLQEEREKFELDRKGLSNYQITDSTDNTFQSARQKYYDPETGKTIKYEVATPSNFGKVKSDILELIEEAGSQKEAELKTRAALRKALNGAVSGNAQLHEGNVKALAGNNVKIKKIGVNSGVFHISESTHTINRGGGYDTSINVFRVSAATPSDY